MPKLSKPIALIGKPSPQQARLITVVSPRQKNEAQKLAEDLTGGDVGDLVRQLIREKYLSHLQAKKAAKASGQTKKVSAKKLAKKASAAGSSSAKNGTSNKALVGRPHGATLKPARKSAAGNTTTKRPKSRSPKGAVPAKRGSQRTGTTAKKSRTTNRRP